MITYCKPADNEPADIQKLKKYILKMHIIYGNRQFPHIYDQVLST